jgi:hypothetical protein
MVSSAASPKNVFSDCPCPFTCSKFFGYMFESAIHIFKYVFMRYKTKMYAEYRKVIEQTFLVYLVFLKCNMSCLDNDEQKP